MYLIKNFKTIIPRTPWVLLRTIYNYERFVFKRNYFEKQ